MESEKKTRKPLVSVVGAACCAILYAAIPREEGTKTVAYRDPVGLLTICSGHTGDDIIAGRVYTKDECQAMLDGDLSDHAQAVLKCAPILEGKTYFLAASTDFAYNKGDRRFCDSAIAEAFRAGNFPVACRRFNESDDGKPQWSSVKDKQVIGPDGKIVWTYKTLPGLVKRQADQRALCEKGL